MKKTANFLYLIWHTICLQIKRTESDCNRQKRMQQYEKDRETELKLWKFKN